MKNYIFGLIHAALLALVVIAPASNRPKDWPVKHQPVFIEFEAAEWAKSHRMLVHGRMVDAWPEFILDGNGGVRWMRVQFSEGIPPAVKESDR